MRKPAMDWKRVATILRAHADDEILTCMYCRATGSIPYLAEHLLTTHPTTKEGRQIAKVVLAAQK